MNEHHTLLNEMCCYGEVFPGSVTSAELCPWTLPCLPRWIGQNWRIQYEHSITSTSEREKRKRTGRYAEIFSWNCSISIWFDWIECFVINRCTLGIRYKVWTQNVAQRVFERFNN